MTMRVLLAGLVGASANFDRRVAELLPRAAPRWRSPLARSFDGPVSVGQHGWVTPGARVQAVGLQWLNPGFRWKSPARTDPKIHLPPHLQVDTRGGKTAVVYMNFYSGFYWGKAQRVSGRKRCFVKACVMSPDFSKLVRYERDSKAIWPGSSLLGIVAPAPPDHLNPGLGFETASDFNLVIAGPVAGHIYFKPLFWATSGWYSQLSINVSSSFVQGFQIDARFPISFGHLAEGAYAFVPNPGTNRSFESSQ